MSVQEWPSGLPGSERETVERSESGRLTDDATTADESARKTDERVSAVAEPSGPADETPRCKLCNASVGASDVVVNHPSSDPLVVSECPRCGSIVSIGGHDW